MTLACAVFWGTLLLFESSNAFGAGEGDEPEETSADNSAVDLPELVTEEDKELMDEFAFLEDATIVESAARHRQKIGMSPSAITVITREDIEASGASTFYDLMRMVPGADVMVSTAMFTSVGMRLDRNFNDSTVLVLIDGREANTEVFGFTLMNTQPLSLDDIERIEFIRGGGSALYGANALAGVVNITTRATADKFTGRARFEAGEPGRFRVYGYLSHKIFGWGLSVNGGADSWNFINDPRQAENSNGRRNHNFRVLTEKKWADEHHLLAEFSLSRGIGSVSSLFGDIRVTDISMKNLRLRYKSSSIVAQIYWAYMGFSGAQEKSIYYTGIHLADFMPNTTMNSHTLDGSMQWTVPELWDPLLLIVGGNVRAMHIGSDTFVDGEGFSDPTSDHYHQPGVNHWQSRFGVYLHSELAPWEWLTVTGGVRVDYNNITDWFVSPRLAAVFKAGKNQFFRLGVNRAFRKPYWMESHAHINVIFPDDSPIQGPAQDQFREFMSKNFGNKNLGNETLLALEAGYRGEFLDEKLTVTVDGYFNQHRNTIKMTGGIVLSSSGLPTLDPPPNRFVFANIPGGYYIYGGEITVGYQLSKSLLLQAWYAHRQVEDIITHKTSDEIPKNYFSLGGRYLADDGLRGSLYFFGRSEYTDRRVIPATKGLLDQPEVQHIDHNLLVMARLGYLWSFETFSLEAGGKLFLPITLSSSPHFSARDQGGGVDLAGDYYGSVEIPRLFSAYLKGSF